MIRDGSMFHPKNPKFEAWASQPIESVTGTSGTKVVDFSVDVTGLKREDEVAILDLDGCCVEMGSKNMSSKIVNFQAWFGFRKIECHWITQAFGILDTIHGTFFFLTYVPDVTQARSKGKPEGCCMQNENPLKSKRTVWLVLYWYNFFLPSSLEHSVPAWDIWSSNWGRANAAAGAFLGSRGHNMKHDIWRSEMFRSDHFIVLMLQYHCELLQHHVTSTHLLLWTSCYRQYHLLSTHHWLALRSIRLQRPRWPVLKGIMEIISWFVARFRWKTWLSVWPFSTFVKYTSFTPIPDAQLFESFVLCFRHVAMVASAANIRVVLRSHATCVDSWKEWCLSGCKGSFFYPSWFFVYIFNTTREKNRDLQHILLIYF